MITPLNNKILVKVKKEDETTHYGIILQGKDKEIVIGECLTGEYEGKKVIFNKFQMESLDHIEKDLGIIEEEGLLAIYED